MSSPPPRIDALAWDGWNLDHIAKHAVTQDEVEEVIAGAATYRASYKNRIAVTGPAQTGRMLTSSSANRGQGAPLLRLQRPAGLAERATRLSKRARMRCAMTTHHNYSDAELGYPTKAHGRIPSFGPEVANRLTGRLDRADRAELAERARAMGIGPSTLARMWLKERLRREAEAERSSR
jgi:hypothetical protein